jgi:O-methyltransferase
MVKYKPSILGRLARITIPLLQKILPYVMYKVIYNFLYLSYKLILKKSYILHVLVAKLSYNRTRILRAQLTRQLLPYTMGGRKALENAFDIVKLIEDNNVTGVLIECGVAEGGTAAMLGMANRELGNGKRKMWFFDSYEGLPEPTKEDYEDGKTGHFIRPLPKGACLGTLEQVSKLLFSTLNFKKNDVYLVKGWFQDTVPKFRDKVGSIAILRLDGDWYESVKIPLDNFYNDLSIGGVVIVDDYATCFGSKKATDEFRAENNITTPLISDGRGGAWFEKSA